MVSPDSGKLQHCRKWWNFLIRRTEEGFVVCIIPSTDGICRRAGSIGVDRKLGLNV